MKRLKYICLIQVGLFSILTLNAAHAAPLLEINDTRDYTQKLFQRLTGVPIMVTDPKFRRMMRYVDRGGADNLMQAAGLALNDHRFYSVRMRTFAAMFSNIEQNPQVPFDDLQALIIGATRDELDFREILTGDFRYQGYPDLGLPAVSRADNNHYLQFDARGHDPWRSLTRVRDQWDDVEGGSGVFTTRSWAESFYNMGTNRIAVKFTFHALMCTEIEKWRFRATPDLYVGRDVPRDPEGNPATYQNHCRTCHGVMDGLRGAFARYDFKDDAVQFMGGDAVASKMNQNGDIYPEGYFTFDDSWENFMTLNPSLDFGWRTPTSGKGLNAFAEMIANSKGFSRCMVKRVFKEVCSRDLKLKERDLQDSLADSFESDGYNIKNLFGRVGIEEACIKREG